MPPQCYCSHIKLTFSKQLCREIWYTSICEFPVKGKVVPVLN
jgi:hypothetical protein